MGLIILKVNRPFQQVDIGGNLSIEMLLMDREKERSRGECR